MNQTVEVKMGGLEIIKDELTELKTFVGSCVAICLFDASKKIAGMAHVVLPTDAISKECNSNNQSGKFADLAFDLMWKKMIQMGADPKRIQAKMAGGATIFSHESQNDVFNVGPRNTEAIRKILQEKAIPIVGEDTGKNFGRWVRFDLKSCKMSVISNLEKTKRVI